MTEPTMSVEQCKQAAEALGHIAGLSAILSGAPLGSSAAMLSSVLGKAKGRRELTRSEVRSLAVDVLRWCLREMEQTEAVGKN